MRKLLLVLSTIFSLQAFAQQSIIRLPRDSMNSPLMAGLGLPYLYEPSITNTTFNTTDRITLPSTGADLGRQWRHLWIQNPDASLNIYVCVGDSTGCSRDMWKGPAGLGTVDDFAYFGPGNNVTHLYYRLSSAGTVVPTIRIW